MVSQNNFPVKAQLTPKQDTTPFGGVLPFLKIVGDLKILHRLPCDRTRSQGWLDAQMVLSIILLNILGFDRVADIDHLENDTDLCMTVRRLELKLYGRRRATLSARLRRGRNRTFPSQRTVHDWLSRYHDDAAAQARIKDQVYIPPPAQELQSLHLINKFLITQQITTRGVKHLTIDIDATIIPSGKKECLPIYRVTTGKVPYETGYQPLIGYSPELDMILHTEMRDGNVPASQDILRFLVEVLEMLPASITSVLVRMDSAGYQHEFMNYCNDPLCRSAELQRFDTIHFVCGEDKTPSTMDAIRATPAADWQPCPLGTPGLSAAEVSYVPAKFATRPKEECMRYIAYRQEINGLEMGHDDVEGEHWPGVDSSRLRLLVTNYPAVGETDGSEPEMDMWSVWAEANQRCGDSEQAHAMVKDDFAGGMMPSGRFGANSCWFFLACLSQNLVMYSRPLMTRGTV